MFKGKGPKRPRETTEPAPTPAPTPIPEPIPEPVPSTPPPFSASLSLASQSDARLGVTLSTTAGTASWRLQWGDGAEESGAALPPSLQHVYAQDGDYTVRLTAQDAFGQSAEDAVGATIRIRNSAADSSVSAACTKTYTGSLSDAAAIQTWLGTATAGDIMCLPAGTGTWTSGVSWAPPPNVQLWGAGNRTVRGGGDQTVIVDGFDNFFSGLFQVTPNPSGYFRLAGITIRGLSTFTKENGVISVGGSSTNWRIDHFHMDMATLTGGTTNHKLIAFSGGPLAGVVDSFKVTARKTNFLAFKNGEDSGNVQWAAPTDFGGSNFVFAEDFEWVQTKDPDTNSWHGTVTDCHTGGRFVVRFGTIYGAGAIGQTHPTGHGAGRDRGCRAFEVYANTVMPHPEWNNTIEPPFTALWISAGTEMVWGNTAIGATKQFLNLHAMRVAGGPGCGGTATYCQDPTPAGWGYCGTEFNGTGSNWDGNNTALYGYPCIDQPGRGQGDRLVGDFPSLTNQTTGTIAWPNQAQEPVYEWSNSFVHAIDEGWEGFLNINNGNRIALDRDLYSEHFGTCTAGGACTSGVGVGTTLPTSCTTGVGFWKTNEGSWNSGTHANYTGQGRLYKCTAPNTWTAHYTPYTYPHPLRSTLNQ